MKYKYSFLVSAYKVSTKPKSYHFSSDKNGLGLIVICTTLFKSRAEAFVKQENSGGKKNVNVGIVEKNMK